jgi:ABC transporter substrate binding protein
VDRSIRNALHFVPESFFPLAVRRENDRSTQNQIVVRGSLPHRCSSRAADIGPRAARRQRLLAGDRKQPRRNRSAALERGGLTPNVEKDIAQEIFRQRLVALQIGLVASLGRPGGNMTGVTLLAVEVGPKSMELLHSAVPSGKSIALLLNPKNPNAATQSKSLQTAAQRLGLQLHVLHASTQSDFDPAFQRTRELKANALMIAQDVVFNTQTGKLAELALRYGIPAIYPVRDFAEAGGLMSYGTDSRDAWRQVGIYAGRILKGEKPADLPVIQASKFELVINLKTAKTIGLTLSPDMLSIADEVIE